MNAAASRSSEILRQRGERCSILLGLAALLSRRRFLAGVGPAEALPSYARQTGQPCAACHTAFPELTPFGRRFKIGGYTLGGGDWKGPPIAAMYMAGFTHTQSHRMRRPRPDCTPTTTSSRNRCQGSSPASFTEISVRSSR